VSTRGVVSGGAGRSATWEAFRGKAVRGYDGAMRKPSLTLDTFVAALAVLGMSASTSCSKAEKDPGLAPAPAGSTITITPNVATPSPVGATPTDAGAAPDGKAGHASCGAGTCSADMKKGN
jgi:hypothetical protein